MGTQVKKNLSKKSGQNPERSKQCVLEATFREDLRFWVESDRKVALRVLDLLEVAMKEPFGGIGKPEPLKYGTANTWSRRITDEHRLVYVIQNEAISFTQARFHYAK
jgi:toxin YoeB